MPWDSAVTDLSGGGTHGTPTTALTLLDGLSVSCTDHVIDGGPCALSGHNGRDKSQASERASRYITWTGTGENLSYARYSDTDGVAVITQFIVDDGVLSRGHRTNIYNPAWTHTGIACGCNSQYGDVCCIQYATNGVNKAGIPSVETITR